MEKFDRWINDQDGVYYNSFPDIVNIVNFILQRDNYLTVSQEKIKENFTPDDWINFYTKIGIKPEEADLYKKKFITEFKKSTFSPELIPNAKNIIAYIAEKIGKENNDVVTNTNIEDITRRFERDGLMQYFNKIYTPTEGKAKELYQISNEHSNQKIIYIGDLTADGRAVQEARSSGAKNLYFGGILHKYAFSPKQLMIDFINKYSINKKNGFAQPLNNLEEIKKLI